MNGREARDRLYEQFAQTAKAAASPKRLMLLELLAQGERGVDALAQATGMGVTNTSAHLQVLRQARLVEIRKVGTKVFYRLADDEIASFMTSLRQLAQSRLAEVNQIVQDYFVARDALEPLTRDELAERASRDDIVVLDVRPREEYLAGHIPGARSVPLDDLESTLSDLPKDAQIIAYCRGPYCVLAPAAVERLQAEGFQARRLTDGMPEWRMAGLPVAVGDE